MFTSSYKLVNKKLQLTRVGMAGSVMTFMMLTLMIQWPLLQTQREFSAFSQFILWTGPILFSVLLASLHYAIAKWRSSRNATGFSYGVTYHWTLASLLPVAVIASLAEYFMLQPATTAVLHASGLIVALILYGLLLMSSQKMRTHRQILKFSYGFYALAGLLQVLLFLF